MSTFKKAIAKHNNIGLTNNGAITYKSSANSLVDLFFLVGASRGKNITPVFEAAYTQNPEIATRIMLHARDIRQGSGERQLFRDYLVWLEQNDFNILMQIIESGLISELGRFDDYLVLTHTVALEAAFGKIAEALSDPNRIGLAAKWMPRQGAMAGKLANYFRLSARNWRKQIVASSNTVEQQMCAKKWSEINFNHVPSLASARYKKAFAKNTPETYKAYMESLVKKDGSAKVNAGAVYPYDIFRSLDHYNTQNDVVSQAQWDALPNWLVEDQGIIPIADVSGSMGTAVPGTSIRMIDVAVSLAAYVALKQEGPFNRVMYKFSSNATLMELKGHSLRQIQKEILGDHYMGSTDLQSAFSNLLSFAIKNRIPQEDMPKILLIISDMEFNQTCDGTDNFTAIERKYAASGYTRPNIVFWNLNGRSGNSPVTFDERGTALVSGFSPSIMKNIVSNKSVTPESMMLQTVMNPRYDFTKLKF